MIDDAKWLLPCTLITLGVLIAAAAIVPISGFRSPPPVGDFVIGWSAVMLLYGGIWLLHRAVVLMFRRVDTPVTELVRGAQANRKRIAVTTYGFVLTGVVQLGFNWLKPQLAIVFPFWADPRLADLDRAAFGTDPWLPMQEWMGPWIRFFDWVYSLWYPVTLLAVFGVLLARRSRALVAYFMLWGLFGPTVQACLSSAGPIFWRRIGLGQRFDGLFTHMPFGTENAANYLWRAYETQANAVAVGISAMPSMHVAMSAWIALTYSTTRFAIAGIVYWMAVFTGSVALGWHYVVDGMAGTAGALLCWSLAGIVLSRPRNLAAPPGGQKEIARE